MAFTILNIGHDSGLTSPEPNEVKTRQLFYSNQLDAKIFHIVKAKKNQSTAPQFINENVIVYPCNVRHWILFPFKALMIARYIIKHHEVNIIQVQEPYLAGTLGLILSKITKIPLVVGLYSDEIGNKAWIKERKLNYLADWVGRVVLRHAQAIRSDSRTVAENISPIINKKVSFIPFLIGNAETFQITGREKVAEFRKKLLGDKAGPLLFAANRLESEKNVSMLLKAVSIVKKDFPELILIIAGSGRMQNDLMTESNQILGDSARWLGWVKSDEMASYYQAADLFLITSNRESAARVLYESLLAGTPVISTNTAGANEIIDDGLNGRIINVGDSEAFAKATIEILSNKDLIEHMSQQAKIKGDSTVSNQAIIEKMKSFYRPVLNKMINS